MLKDLRNAFQLATRRAWNDGLIPATLGKAEGSNQYTLEVPGKGPSWMYVTLSDKTVAQAVNLAVGRMAKLPVWLDRDPSGVLYIVGVNITQAQQFLGDYVPAMGVGQHSHEIGYGYADVVSPRRIKGGLVTVSSGMEVAVGPFLYEYDGAWALFAGDTLDLTGDLPSTSGTRSWSVVWFDPVTATLGSTAGSEIATTGDLTLAQLAAVTLSGDIYPLAGVMLSEGQSAITEEKDFLDARLWLGRLLNTIQVDWLLKPATTLTISGGAVTATRSQHIIAAESGSTDDLDTINGLASGQFYLIRADAGDTITIKHGTDNIELNGEEDFDLSGNKCLLLYSPDGSTAVDIGGSDLHAIHDNIAGEISAVTEKTGPISADLVLIEDSESSNAKKKVQLGNIPIGGSTATLDDAREVLTAARTYYVDGGSGDDGNDGLSSGAGAWATINHASDVVSALDTSIYAVIVNIAAGTYSEDVILHPWVGGGSISFIGDVSTPSNVVISSTSHCFAANAPGAIYALRGMQLTSSGGNGIQAAGKSYITFQSIDFASCSTFHLYATTGAQLAATGNYSISAGAQTHWTTSDGGIIYATGLTITLTGTPAFSSWFAYASDIGAIKCYSDTFSGSATGSRYFAELNGVIFTNGGGATYLPGNAGGSTATGGQYA